MTKAEFVDWKSHVVTQEIFNQLKGRQNDLKEMLADSAGLNPLQDREFVGAIKAYNDLLDIQYEEEEETQ